MKVRLRWLLKKAGEGIVQSAAWAAILLITYLLWGRIRDEVQLPLWVLIVAIGIPAAFAIGQTIRKYKALSSLSSEHTVETSSMFDTLFEIQDALQQNQSIAYYAKHLYEILATLQRSMAGVIPNVKIDEFIEYGVLHPARDLLKQVPEEDVRLSVLMPDKDKQSWHMVYAAGHSLESRQAFSLPIETSFSRLAYETGKLVWSNDLSDDERFFRHPNARPERAYESMMSVPVRRGDQAIGVLNVISTAGDAFSEADRTYAQLLGAVVEIVEGMKNAGIPDSLGCLSGSPKVLEARRQRELPESPSEQ